MRTKTPTVWQDPWRGTATLDGGLQLDTPAWFAWLEEATTRSFAYPIDNAAQGYIEAFLTVRKEQRQRGSAYWTAYSHVGGQMRKAYVGRSSAVTDAHLRAIAAALLERILCPTQGEAPAPSRAPRETRGGHQGG
jgi:LuxR family transcriptional regulator, maltose regulon positive regulatory protein